MATTYTWDVENVEVLDSHNGNENVVYRVVWKCTATNDSGASKYQVGVVDLDINNTSTQFISIETVTKQNIIDWVTATVAVNVIERDLLPGTTTVNFTKTTSTTVTVAEQMAIDAAEKETPSPDN